jgi:ubiquinone/menaquinone biosynthesis C-methylase UbiE
MDVTCLDLSPYYLANARDNLKYWRQIRAPASQKHTSDTFIQAAAEDISADDNSYDVVTCIYLFHELPAAVRRKAAAEMARVCKPGGMVVLTDSVQLGDREAFDPQLGQFGNFNEPYYQGYINSDIGQLFEEAGLLPHMKTVASSTKSLSFKKPLKASAAQPEAPPLPASVIVNGSQKSASSVW